MVSVKPFPVRNDTDAMFRESARSAVVGIEGCVFKLYGSRALASRAWTTVQTIPGAVKTIGFSTGTGKLPVM